MFAIDFLTFYQQMSMTDLSSLNHSLNVCVSRLDGKFSNIGLTKDLFPLAKQTNHIEN